MSLRTFEVAFGISGVNERELEYPCELELPNVLVPTRMGGGMADEVRLGEEEI